MKNQLLRVGTIYIPVQDPARSSEWYSDKLRAKLKYLDEDKAILDLTDISLFLVKSINQSSNFFDSNGNERFVLTYEVDGLEALLSIHKDFKERGIKVEEIENRGHAGRNFVFYDLDGNQFDVWSELSRNFKEEL
ncbi:VOC family protein [Mesobacillus subterraneus]|uniref:VOC family protein n=1 Tax=Mesobacillus subterraneus TaxID=285983 RepID=UPI00203C0D90|nr:VOC family protein [Mesobacillus subterraneus]MCM3666122.1 VOC family protein [Mesobacillus subterraneus]MCM3685120.1 VOC family protein [Mesobacillus subterraneus]